MPRLSKIRIIDRIIDANLNRTKEGLRVCEEITRFILNSRNLTEELKKIRHKIDIIIRGLITRKGLISQRNSLSDVGKNVYINELKRSGYKDIFFANIQRVKESIRVLEEFAKLKDTGVALRFKKTRYAIYQLEKKISKKL